MIYLLTCVERVKLMHVVGMLCFVCSPSEFQPFISEVWSSWKLDMN